MWGMSVSQLLRRGASIALVGASVLVAPSAGATAAPPEQGATRSTTIPGPQGSRRTIVRYRTAGLRVTSITDHHANQQITTRSLFKSRISPASTLVVTELGPGRPERLVVTHHTGLGGSMEMHLGIHEPVPAHMMPDQPPPPFPGRR